jgi:hypothetical protein
VIEVLIPYRGEVNDLLLVAIQKNLSNPYVGRVHVSVNPSEFGTEELEPFRDNQKFTLTLQTENLGLYGNFRYLVNSAVTPFIVFQCGDDVQTDDYSKMVKQLNLDNKALAIPEWCWREFNPSKGGHYGEEEAGVYPSLTSRRSRFLSCEIAEPSWIFGVWRTNYLKSIFPSNDFDWLDFFLLQKSLCENQVVRVETNTRLVIGTWRWANKVPHSVSRSGPKAYDWSKRFMTLFLLHGVFWHPVVSINWVKRLIIIAIRARKLRQDSIDR